jgi:nucleotide-binding universal stress UspA family protein
MSTIQNILVAVDFSNADEVTLSQALQMAQKFGAKAWIMHVAMPDPDFVGYDVGPQYIRDARAKDLRGEHKTLKQYGDNFKEAGVEAESLLIQGPTADTILEEVAKLNIDLIVIAAHKHGFLSRLFGEINPSELAMKSNIPWLVVPEKAQK